jgi:hypothetical protein
MLWARARLGNQKQISTAAWRNRAWCLMGNKTRNSTLGTLKPHWRSTDSSTMRLPSGAFLNVRKADDCNAVLVAGSRAVSSTAHGHGNFSLMAPNSSQADWASRGMVKHERSILGA